MDATAAEKALYKQDELAADLIDWVDGDDIRQSGGSEDDYYQGQDPPYRAANRPLLSVEELALVEGFDGPLMEALRPYLTVFPYADGGGINPNTAPTWVLALLFHGTEVDGKRLAGEDLVADLRDAREEHTLCGEEGPTERCVLLTDLGIDPNTAFPAPTLWSNVFHVRAEARVGEIHRRLDVVIDRVDPLTPRLLSWRMR